MRNLFTLLAGLLLSALSYSQINTGIISGVITDESQKPLQAVSVSLLRAKDSSLVKVAVTDKEGKYEFDKIKDGKYLVSVSSVGFQKRFGQSFEISAENVTVKAEVIRLSPESRSLENVTVAAKKPFIETKIDKTVVNV